MKVIEQSGIFFVWTFNLLTCKLYYVAYREVNITRAFQTTQKQRGQKVPVLLPQKTALMLKS